MLRPPDVKSWLIGKDPDAGKDWRQEEKRASEDEVIGWHHRLNGLEFGQISRDGEGQENLAYCTPWGHRVRHESETEQQPFFSQAVCFVGTELCELLACFGSILYQTCCLPSFARPEEPKRCPSLGWGSLWLALRGYREDSRVPLASSKVHLVTWTPQIGQCHICIPGESHWHPISLGVSSASTGGFDSGSFQALVSELGLGASEILCEPFESVVCFPQPLSSPQRQPPLTFKTRRSRVSSPGCRTNVRGKRN